MNRISQRNELEKELQNYKDYVPFCPFDSLPMLMFEIAKLYQKLAKIKKMDLKGLTQKVEYDFETINSKLNFNKGMYE